MTRLAGMLGLLLALTATAQARSLNGFELDDAIIPVKEIRRGGPPRDGIPALTDPAFVEAGDAERLDATDRVLGVAVNGEARAYPIGILNYHEIVNDVIGGRPVAVTYCPLCNSGVVFDASVEGERRLFGVSGLLYNSDVLLYDRDTESLWSQLMGRAVTGPLAGETLETLPVRHTTWRDWRERHPETLVLSDDTGFHRAYYRDPYRDYHRSRAIMFPVASRSGEYHPKALVLGLELGGEARAWPFEELPKGSGSFGDEIAGREVTVHYDRRNKTAHVTGPEGEIPATITYWFAWYAFHPGTSVYRAEEG